MNEDYPELPDFLNRKLNPVDASSQHGGQTRRHKPKSDIVWPHAKIEKALRERKKLKRQAAKEKAKQRKEWNG